MDAVVVALCGLPGAGKTTLARQWIERHGCKPIHCPGEGAARPVVIECFRFDDLYATGARSAATEPFDPVLWKATQEEMAVAVTARLSRHRQDAPDSVLLLLIDDNFHYRSMRKRFWQVANEEACGFGIIYVATPVAACRRRNAARHGAARVPETAFTRMARVFEVPDAAFAHDRNTVTVSPQPQSRVLQAGDAEVSMVDFERSIDLVVSQAEAEVRAARATKFMHASQLLQKVADKNLTATSVLHNVDLALRRWISLVLRGEVPLAISVDNKDRKAQLAKYLNEQRKALLIELKGEDHGSKLHDGGVEQIQRRFQEAVVKGFPDFSYPGAK